MKFSFLILCFTIVYAQSAVNTYFVESIGHFSISQTQVDNWQQGGENSITWQVNVKTNIGHDHGFWSESHLIDLSFGKTRTGDMPMRKSIDEIKIDSEIRLNLPKGRNPYIAINTLTQFAIGYDYNGDSPVSVSDFLDPLYLTESTGLTKQFNSGIRTRGGFAMKQTITRNYPSPYADVPETPETEKIRYEYGMEWINQFEKIVKESTSISARLELFSNLKALDETDVRFETILSTQISEMVDVSFNVKVVYDKDTSSRRQVRQFLSLGFSYSIL